MKLLSGVYYTVYIVMSYIVEHHNIMRNCDSIWQVFPRPPSPHPPPPTYQQSDSLLSTVSSELV